MQQDISLEIEKYAQEIPGFIDLLENSHPVRSMFVSCICWEYRVNRLEVYKSIKKYLETVKLSQRRTF